MKLLSQASRLSNSPFRRRHPTAEEIVEEVYRRVQEQQQQQQQQREEEAHPKSRSNYVHSVTKNSPSSSNTSINSGVNRSSTSSHSPESRTDNKVGERTNYTTKNDSRQKTRSITPFGRRRNNPTNDKKASLDVTLLVAEYTSHNPGRVVLDSPKSHRQSTTFLSVEDKIDDEIRSSTPKDSRPTSRGRASSSWASIRRKKSLDSADSTLHHRNTFRLQQKSSQSSGSINMIEISSSKVQQSAVVDRSQRGTTGVQKGIPSPSQSKSPSRQARSMSPFFRRGNKPASELIAEAKKNAIELSRVNDQPSTARVFRGDRSLSGIDRADTKQVKPLPPGLPSPVSPPRRARSLSPFSRRKSANEVIADVYRRMEIDYSNSTTGSSNDEDGVEIVLARIADPASPNHGFLRKRTPLSSPTAINVLCNNSPNKNHNDEDGTGGLQTIATVLFKDPQINNRKKEDSGQRNNEKSIRGRKSILLSKAKPEAAPTKVETKTTSKVNGSKTTVNANRKESSLEAKKKRRGLIHKFKSNEIPLQPEPKVPTIKEPQSPTPKLRLDLVPPSSIAVGGRSRVSELSVPNPPKTTTAIPFSSRVKTRSLGERSLAEIQTALEKVQKELTGATKTGQTIPRDLVMEKLLAVADTIEAPDDRQNFLRKLSRLGSTTLSQSSGDGATTSDDSDSSDDEDTSTDRGDTSGDESSFARWTMKHGKGKQASVGQWTRMLQALGLNGFWDDDIDLEDLDMSHESVYDNDDNDQTDEDTTVRTPTPTPPIIQKMSFTGLIGQITSIGSFRDDTISNTNNNEPIKADVVTQPEKQVQAYDDTEKRIAIADEERMLRELEEMDRKIQAEKLLQRKSQASERLKALAANLQKENEQLDRSKTNKHHANDDDIPESVIEMYVQELSAESRKAIADEQRLRRVIEEEIMKQKLVDTVLNKFEEEKLLNTKKVTAPVAVAPSTASKLGTSHDTKSLVESTTPSSRQQQLSASHTRTTLGSGRSRFTGATSVRRSLLGVLSPSVQREQISASNTGTIMGSASLMSQPQTTLSTITSNTGYTYETGPSLMHQANAHSVLDGATYSKNHITQGSSATEQFNSMSMMSDDKETYYGNQSKVHQIRSQTPQPSVSSNTNQSWVMKQSQPREPPARNNSICDSKFDMNDDTYDDALSVGSIESDQFDTGCQYSVGTGRNTELSDIHV